ncbi:hypothetical protein ABZW30_23630 [Kitasatospora sp. NPDC004669]|uniref:hypothetical protein n=1 Tax=Kitasatospora sp. NPDC004669 TaxID=3154555 RepID=UPI0033B8E65C
MSVAQEGGRADFLRGERGLVLFAHAHPKIHGPADRRSRAGQRLLQYVCCAPSGREQFPGRRGDCDRVRTVRGWFSRRGDQVERCRLAGPLVVLGGFERQ